MKIYRIRNTKTGLFSKGGGDANLSDRGSSSWTKNGKIWQGLGPLRNHLNLFIGSRCGLPAHWEIIEYDLSNVPAKTTPVHEVIDPKKLVEILSK